jgi:predicted Holliday junction resolvase-like endonuclease
MKDKIILLVVIVILSLVIYNAWQDIEEVNSKELFYKEMLEFKKTMEGFKNKGRRNTADQGQALCERINEIEVQAGKQKIDCAELYQ